MKRAKSLILFPLYVSKRYLLSGGEPCFASFLTLVSMSGVAIGIAALIVVISVMAGFRINLESKLMGFNPHVTVMTPATQTAEIVRKIGDNFDGIKEIDQFVVGEVVVETGGGEALSAMGAKVIGYKDIPQRLRDSADFYWGLGMLGDAWWMMVRDPLRRGVIVGNEMSYQVGAFPGMDERVKFIAPFGGVDPLGNPKPTVREYSVVGGFKSGFFEYDAKYILMNLLEAGRLLRSQGRYGIEIMLDDSEDIDSTVKNLKAFLGNEYDVSGWTEKNKRLLSALKLEKMAMTFLLLLIIIIASFSIIGVSLMIFFSKRKDLAVMVSMGASKSQIEKIFLFHGGLIGLVGAALGVLLGFSISLMIEKGNVALPPSYYLDRLPVSISYFRMFIVAAGGVLVSLAASLYPARRAATLNPLELLRYE